MKPLCVVLLFALITFACSREEPVKSKYVEETRECYHKEAATGDVIRFSLRLGGCQTVTFDEFGNAYGSGTTIPRTETVRCVSGADSQERLRTDDFYLLDEGPVCTIAGADHALLHFYVGGDSVVLGIRRGDLPEKQLHMGCDQPKTRIVNSKEEC